MDAADASALAALAGSIIGGLTSLGASWLSQNAQARAQQLLDDKNRAAPAEAERAFFEEHLSSWIWRFFGDLERAAPTDLYARVGAVGRIFIDIETKALALPA